MVRWGCQNDIPVMLCVDCGLGQARMPAQGADACLYDGGYHTAAGYTPERFERLVRRAWQWISRLGELRQPGVLLDIGCALGYYMAAAQQLGWTAYGTDIASHVVEQTRERGFEAFVSRHPAEFPSWLPPLDGVVLAHVVEHFPDPFDYLSALRRHMSPGGVAYIELPDFGYMLRRGPVGAPWHGPPEHLWFFTRPAAAQMLARCGWETVATPRLRGRLLRDQPARWPAELLVHWPRELLRDVCSARGLSRNLHLFARAV